MKAVLSESDIIVFRITQRRRLLCFAVAAVGLFLCCWGVWSTARAGASRALSNNRMGNPLTAIDEDLLSHSDPEAYRARALLLSGTGQLSEAVKAYERAVALRPRDYILWLWLGSARSQSGDETGALAAFSQAVHLAPYYAHPRWELGSLLHRAGRRDEAFIELRRAALSDPGFLMPTINLAWDAYEGDTQAIRQAIQPHTAAAHLALARFFANHGKTAEAIDVFRAAKDVSERERSEFLTELLDAKRFAIAYGVWSSGRESSEREDHRGVARITDGGFENDDTFDESEFSWQVMLEDAHEMEVTQDANQPRAGAKSLRLDFSGLSDPTPTLLSQLVLVEPNSRYRLSFAARTEKLVTGGLPVITVTDANSAGGDVLASSAALPEGTSEWRDYKIEFMTADATNAVRISVRRESCAETPCPIFGRVWFDAFALQKM